jgi:hypothetical protein
MKTIMTALTRFLIVLGIILMLGSTGVGQVRADPPEPQLTPAGPPDTLPPSPLPPGMARSAEWDWYDGAIKYSTIINCWSIINGSPYTETGAAAWVGYNANPTDGLPVPNYVYYVHVIIYGMGNSCSGIKSLVEIGLPANTSLAISTGNPVYCFFNGVSSPGDCPQTLPASVYNPGFYTVPSPDDNQLWPLPQGYNWEFQIPVTSTTTLTNSTFQGAIWMLDGNESPWLYPKVGVYVFTPPVVNNPVPVLSSIFPTGKWAGRPGSTLILYGSKFVPGSVVKWNGSNRVTTYVNSGQLTAAITTADLATASIATVKVYNPAPGGGTSVSKSFTVKNDVPVITGLYPLSKLHGRPGFTLNVYGKKFGTGAKVRWNGSNRPTTFVSSNLLKATIYASDIATAGIVAVTVFNPAPFGGISNKAAFTKN